MVAFPMLYSISSDSIFLSKASFTLTVVLLFSKASNASKENELFTTTQTPAISLKNLL